MSKKIYLVIIVAIALGLVGYTIAVVNAEQDNNQGQNLTANHENNKASTTPKIIKTVDIACVKTAINKRESTVQTAFDSFNTIIKSALQTRQGALDVAWSTDDKAARNKAIKAAWTNWRAQKREAAKVFNQARRAAWKQFVVERKACKAPATGEIEGQDLSF